MIRAYIKGLPLVFETSPTLFSPESLDAGTLAMLSIVEFGPNDKVLDLGCGYGVVGIVAAKTIGPQKVVMSDIDPEAVETSRKNASLNAVESVRIILSDGFRDLTETGFTKILSNPPYHADFSTAKAFIEKGFNRLASDGMLVMVTKRKEWYKNKFLSIFGGVLIAEIDGYFVLTGIRKSFRYARKIRKNQA